MTIGTLSAGKLRQSVGLRRLSLVLLVLGFPFPAFGVDIGISLVAHFLIAVGFVLININKFSITGSDIWYWLFLVWAALSIFFNMLMMEPVDIVDAPLRLTALRWLFHLWRLGFFLIYMRVLQNVLQMNEGTLVRTFVLWLALAAGITIIVSVVQLVAFYGNMPFVSFANLPHHNITGGLPTGSYFSGMKVPRIVGTFSEPKWYASFITFAWPLLLGGVNIGAATRPVGSVTPIWDFKGLVLKWVAFGLIGCLILTFSRSGLLVFLVQLALLGILVSPVRVARYGLVFAISGFVALQTFGVDPVRGGMEFTSTLWRTGDVGMSHLHAIQVTMPLILEKPILGHGPGGFLFATIDVLPQLEGVFTAYASGGFLDATSLPIYILASTGIIGTIFFGMYLLSRIRHMVGALGKSYTKTRSKNLSILLILAIVSVAGCLLTYAIEVSWNQLWLWTSIAFASTVATLVKRGAAIQEPTS